MPFTQTSRTPVEGWHGFLKVSLSMIVGGRPRGPGVVARLHPEERAVAPLPCGHGVRRGDVDLRAEALTLIPGRSALISCPCRTLACSIRSLSRST
jgi:hypothetical protein